VPYKKAIKSKAMITTITTIIPKRVVSLISKVEVKKVPLSKEGNKSLLSLKIWSNWKAQMSQMYIQLHGIIIQVDQGVTRLTKIIKSSLTDTTITNNTLTWEVVRVTGVKWPWLRTTFTIQGTKGQEDQL